LSAGWQNARFRRLQGRLNNAGNAHRDFVLYVEHVFERAVEAVSPKLRPAEGVDQLRDDAHATVRLAHRSFKDMRTPNSRPTCFTSTAWPL
jgi:hypothetical protein